MPRYCWRAIFLAAVFLSGALGNWNDTSTGIDLDKLRRFPVTKIRSGWLKDGARATFEGITATAASADVRGVQLRGAGKSGKRWEAHIFGLDEVWRADLDGNGTQDYVFFASGPYFNGRMTPPFSISILLMDKDGLPIPFFTTVYHGENGDGIKHLVDLNNDGHAELLASSYDENVSDPRVGAFCSGHWITRLFRFRNLGVEEMRGTIGRIGFPFVHDWTYRGTKCAEEEKPFMPVQPPALLEGEGGTSRDGEVITMIRESNGGNEPLAIDPVAGCKAILPTVIVYDRPTVREIAFPSLWSSYSADLADAIRRDRAPVRLRGVNKWMGNGDCTVNLMWAAK